jgi:hypothetical protein
MGATFEISETHEVFRDPMGHYHHWTILFGRVLEGTLHEGDELEVGAIGGAAMATRVLGIDAAPRRNAPAGDAGAMIALCTSWPALPPDLIAIARPVEVKAGALDAGLARMLEPALRTSLLHEVRMDAATRAAHRLDGRPVPCRECLRALAGRTDLGHLLAEACEDPRPAVAAAAAAAMAHSGPASSR